MDKKNSEIFPEFTFNVPSYADWLQAAQLELDGADPIEKLSIFKGSLKITPFYHESAQSLQDDFVLKPSTNPYYGARCWMNTPRIVVTDEKKGNELALHYLNSGADGILFEPIKDKIDFNILLNDLKSESCSVSFLIRNGFTKTALDFINWVGQEKLSNIVTGSLFWETYPHLDFLEALSKPYPHYSHLGILIQPQKNVEDEISMALEKAVLFLDQATSLGVSTVELFPQMSFSLSADTDIFLTIAKIKSLRNLWYQIQGGFGITKVHPVHLHVMSTAWVHEKFQPHGNLIKSTTSALAAIVGGCDSLTIEPEDHSSDVAIRVSINVSSILREESHLSRVSDPTAGSYYIDSLTSQLSEKAWHKFQIKMK